MRRPVTLQSAAGRVGNTGGAGPGREVVAATTLNGEKVMSSDGEHVGKIADLMVDVRSGRIAYAVVSTGGFLGLGHTLHGIPWSALTLDAIDRCFVVDIPAQRLKDEPGVDKDHWPSMADEKWGNQVHHYYNREPYWTATRDISEGRETNI
ncbi:PRC-barrel domain-containing protein [Paraburkholderia sp. LEh10]|uniref:PRC-barrel domain-containing protein n=1 Tax=Paraburkholderia sp. LEh10 TaxID=2821353 RepID=UPI001AE2DC16|nr:PRC-barrel domain-containing protein [Paraburkholderia sp. LEh10]MBP0595674.1 PRC-barrel domain-containing protein [Paraburkholderia sp. LEh10]